MIDFDTPQPLNAVMQFLAGKTAMPTHLSTAQLSSLTSDIRQISLYSARTTNAAYLEEVRKQLSDLAAGKINEATARQNLQLWLDHIGYKPETHFGAGADAEIPPADQGSLRDLSSDRRLTLMLETNMRIAANTAFAASGMAPDALHDWPCYNFVRIYTKLHPRGSTPNPADMGWPDRWVQSGGTLVSGDRMIAAKTDDIWSALSDSGVWPDGTDSDVPPFAFNSGFGWEEVDRETSITLGVIDSDDEQGGEPPNLLGDFFDGHPERATLADLRSKKSDILAALAELGKAA